MAQCWNKETKKSRVVKQTRPICELLYNTMLSKQWNEEQKVSENICQHKYFGSIKCTLQRNSWNSSGEMKRSQIRFLYKSCILENRTDHPTIISFNWIQGTAETVKLSENTDTDTSTKPHLTQTILFSQTHYSLEISANWVLL